MWESLPLIYHDQDSDRPAEAIWPFLPVSIQKGGCPLNKQGRIISTANARLRTEGAPFAPTFMGAWTAGLRGDRGGFMVLMSSTAGVKPQIPYAVFPTDAPFWMMAGLARRTILPDGKSSAHNSG